MSFYERYVSLCSEHGLSPQSAEMLEVTGKTSGTITGWSKGSVPSCEVICTLSKHFNVSSDYLLGLSEIRNCSVFNTLSEQEQLLLKTFRNATAEGQFTIIHCAMSVREEGVKGDNISAV